METYLHELLCEPVNRDRSGLKQCMCTAGSECGVCRGLDASSPHAPLPLKSRDRTQGSGSGKQSFSLTHTLVG